MAKGRSKRLSAALALLLIPLSPIVAPSAQAAACVVTSGTVSSNSRYAVFDSGSGCTWTVPTGVTSISYFAVGGGGGGGGANPSANAWFGGGGGGGGGLTQSSSLSVTAGASITLTIGTGGSAGAAGASGGNGSATTFTYSSTTVTAAAGTGGGGATGTYAQDAMSGDGGGNTTYGGGGNVWDGGGGGGGAGAAGGAGTDIGGQGGIGGAGGAGISTTLLGGTLWFGAGGGGGGTPSTNSSETDGYGGSGGSSVGGSGGGGPGVMPTTPTANTGSGGGGGGWRATNTDAQRAGTAGAAGKVIFVFTKNTSTVTGASITSTSGADSTYAIGDVITVTVTTSEAATVTGSPRIAILGLTSKYFTYASGSGTSSLLFTYTVVLSDTASAGVGFNSNALELNSGAINDTAGLAFTITHSAVAQSLSHAVDGIKPTVTYVASNTVPENETKTVSITLSEPGTVVFNAGYDRSHVTYDTNTKLLTFGPHDFEVPTDADLNNQYYVNFTIRDAAGNTGAGSYNLFITVTDVAEAASISAITFSGPVVKGAQVTMTVTASVAGKVDFYWNSKKIGGCIALPTTGTSPNITASCIWKPSVMAASNVYAILKPTSSSFSASTSPKTSVTPARRSGNR